MISKNRGKFVVVPSMELPHTAEGVVSAIDFLARTMKREIAMGVEPADTIGQQAVLAKIDYLKERIASRDPSVDELCNELLSVIDSPDLINFQCRIFLESQYTRHTIPAHQRLEGVHE